MLNVALTRAKKQFFVIGSIKDWHSGRFTKCFFDSDKLIAQKNSMLDFVLECKKKKLIDSHSLLESSQNVSLKKVEPNLADVFVYGSEKANLLSSGLNINQEVQSSDLELVNLLMVQLSNKWKVLEYLGAPLQFADWICSEENKRITSEEKIGVVIDFPESLTDLSAASIRLDLKVNKNAKAGVIGSHQVNIKVFGTVWQAASIRKVCDGVESNLNIFDSYFEITKVLKLQQSDGVVRAEVEVKSNIDFAGIVSKQSSSSENSYYYKDDNKVVQTIEQTKVVSNGFDFSSHEHRFKLNFEFKQS